MSWLDDLVRAGAGKLGKAIDVVGSSVGSLNPNQSFGNNPWIDVSSTLQNWAGNPNSTLKSAIVKPARASDTPAGYYPPGDEPTDNGQILGLQTDSEINWNGTPTVKTNNPNPNPNPNPGTGIDLDAVMRARRARNEGSINSFLDNARGLRDEVFGLTQKKRGQYEDLFRQGDQEITQTFEGEKGNARRTFNDLTSTEGNRARALGLGGSATDYAASRRSEALGRQLGDVNTNASNNRMENKRTRDTRFDQADAWDRQATNDFNTAAGKAQDARNSLLDTEENTVLGWLGNILQNQLSLNALKSGINSETVNPYAVDTSKLTSFLNPTLTGAGATSAGQTEDGVNINDPRAIALMRNPKYSYSGLYGNIS
ncbi:MAG: hypothetical protein IFNCLDLE_02615 [Ignavibacteriaceae bacterium]|nr:hypothetical protein [Ignavibacteriaceae bacterium]